MTIENDDVYTIGFDREEITLAEGMSTIVRLSVDPTPAGADAVIVALSSADARQVAVEPEEVVFSATRASFDVAVSVTEDTIPESGQTFAISLRPPENIPTATSAHVRHCARRQ